MRKPSTPPPGKMNVQITRSEMTALVWTARIVYWQTMIATYENERTIGGMALTVLARAALEQAVTKLEETGVQPEQLRQVTDQLKAKLEAVA